MGVVVVSQDYSVRQDAHKTTVREQERASILSAIAAAQWRDRRDGFLREKAESVLLLQYNLGRGMSRSTAETIWGRDFVRIALGE
jgi:hypothetical protein